MTSTPEQPLAARVRRGALWSIASTLVLRLASILITAVVAHILSPRDFGVFAVALTAYAIVSAIGELGVASCLIRADLDIDSLAPTMATISLTTSAILAGAMAAFARPIAAVLGSAGAAGPVRVMALAVMLVGVFAVPGAQLVRDFKQNKLFLSNIISFVPSTVVLLLLAKSGGGAMAFAWSRVVGQLVSGCVLIASVPKNYRPGIARSALSLLFRFGLPLASANFVNYILLNVDYALVGHLMGAISLGTYVLAFNVASWPSTLLGAMINNVSMPAFSRVKHDADLLKNAMASALRALSLVVMPMCGLIMALARPLVLTLYGVKWAASAEVLTILSLYSAVSVICLLFANILAGLGRTKFLLVVQLVWLGSLAPAMALGVRQGGIVGAAFAHIAIIGPVVLPSYLFALKRTTGVSLAALAKASLPAFLATVAAALAALGTAEQFADPLAQLITGLVAGSLTYLLAVGPQVIVLLDRGQATRLPVGRVLRLYNMAARLVGLHVGGGPKHSANSGVRRGKQTQERVRLDRSARPAAEVKRDRQAVALGVLLSLARLVETADLTPAVLTRPGSPPGPPMGEGARGVPRTPGTFISGNGVARAHREAGLKAAGISVHERTLAECERLLGRDHPDTLTARDDLACVYRATGRLAEAIALFKRSVSDRERLLGASHPSTVVSHRELMQAYRDAGRLAEAIPPQGPAKGGSAPREGSPGPVGSADVVP
jgi:lipopolysaccharide exporter